MAETCDLIIIGMGVGGIEVVNQPIAGGATRVVRRSHVSSQHFSIIRYVCVV
jgi:hypothetical protein